MRGSTGCAATRASHVTERVNMNARETPYGEGQGRDFEGALLLLAYLLIFWTIS